MEITKKQVMLALKNNKTNYGASNELGISLRTLQRLKTKYKIPKKTKKQMGKITQEVMLGRPLLHRRKVSHQQVRVLFKKTQSRKITAALLGISQARVSQILSGYGIRTNHRNTMDKKKIIKLQSMLKQKVPYLVIKKKLKISVATILTYKTYKV